MSGEERRGKERGVEMLSRTVHSPGEYSAARHRKDFFLHVLLPRRRRRRARICILLLSAQAGRHGEQLRAETGQESGGEDVQEEKKGGARKGKEGGRERGREGGRGRQTDRQTNKQIRADRERQRVVCK
eukprot:766202-Hanusia_phi.AAC.3